MNKRLRKKQLKKIGKYVAPGECWNLNDTICDYVLPRLKLFRKYNDGYPGIGDMDAPEKWDEAIDKMIKAFELARTEPMDLYYDDMMNNMPEFRKKAAQWDKDVKEGLHLFAEWFFFLWW